MEYKIKEITPKDMQCVIGGCPAIYEVTPKDMKCGIAACNGIYDNKGSDYYIIGDKVSKEELKELGLEKKVGEGEVMIKINKRIIDDKE